MDMALKMYDARKRGQEKGMKQSSSTHALKYAHQLHQAGKTNEEIFTAIKSLFGDDLSDPEIHQIVNSLN